MRCENVKRGTKMNVGLIAAIAALSRTIDKVDNEMSTDVEVCDARMLRECAAVIARASTDEILTTMKGMKTPVEA
jgi:uncharacterized membrane protein